MAHIMVAYPAIHVKIKTQHCEIDINGAQIGGDLIYIKYKRQVKW